MFGEMQLMDLTYFQRFVEITGRQHGTRNVWRLLAGRQLQHYATTIVNETDDIRHQSDMLVVFMCHGDPQA